MQAEYKDGSVSPIMDFEEKKLLELLEAEIAAEKVTVFKKGSPEHIKAKKKYSQMTVNQKKQWRRQNR